ncbi:MAG: fibronectin type III domain-containing protein [Candidatus Nanopelagicales bacterium]
MDNPGGAPVGTCQTQADLTCVIEGLPLVDGDRVASYVLRVSARSAEGDGAWSAPIAFEPGSGLVGPPDPVTNLLGLGEDRCIVVSWVPSASNGGLPITSQTMNVGGAVFPAGLADTQQRVCGLTNGDAYQVQVVLRNALGEAESEVISVTPQAAPPPPPPPAAPPQAPSAPVGVAGNTVVELTWAAAPTADADQVSGYHVQRRVAGTDAWADVTDNTGTSLTRLTVTSLANGRGYEFRVRAINADGPGPWSDASAAVTPRSDRPGAPGRPVGTAGNGEVALQWAAPQSDGGGEIVGYQVEVSTDGQNWVVAIPPVQPLPPVAPAPPGPPLPPPPPPAPAPVVGPGPAPGPPPVVVPEEPQPGRVASRPDAPTATAGVESARVNWKKPANAGTGAVTYYWVQATPGGLGCESTPEEPLSCVVTGLTPGTSYTFTVEAINPVGFSLPSEPSNAVVPTEAKKGTIAIKATRAKPAQIVVRGTTTGLAAGTKLTPRYRVVVNGKGKWLRGKALTLKKEGGTFTFRIKVKAQQTVQVKVLAPGRVKSNTLTVAPRR